MSGVFARAAARLSLTLPGDVFLRPHATTRGDNFAPEEHAALAVRPSAVLAGLVDHPGAPTLQLTRRAGHLRDHSGQVAFPGGKIDAHDASPLATALREAEEEIGLAPQHVEPIGWLDAWQTGTGYRILPLVARLTPPLKLQPNVAEVARVFEVPLSVAFDSSRFQRQTRIFKGRERSFDALIWDGELIWGATAGIIRHMATRLEA